MQGSKPACWKQRTKVAAETLEDARVHRRSRRRDTRRRLPPAQPPQKVPMGRVRGHIPPLTKTLQFRLVSGTHFFHLCDSVVSPL